MNIVNELFIGIVALFFFAAMTCTKYPSGPGSDRITDAQSVALDKSELAITFAAGDNADYVTNNISLPVSGANGTSISWITSNSSRITIEGIVSRPPMDSGDALVTLTATVSKGISSDIKIFNLTVKENTRSTVTDQDGNVYATIKIGNQEWMVENLRTMKYNDGTSIPHVTDSAAWSTLITPGYCFYNNTTNHDSIQELGALYNWYAVVTKQLAPVGWHVPDTSDWSALNNYLITNHKNLEGLPALWWGGIRGYDGNFSPQYVDRCWWSATESNTSDAYFYDLFYDVMRVATTLLKSSERKGCGFSVRLIRD